jgi:tRNA-2-methylthio-N6-dimethylallyladenosine synthase
LGQNVNSYGNDLSGVDFADLINEISKIEGKFRLRFMTNHPKDLSEKLVKAISDSDKTCRSIHLPVQAGANRILKLMNRRYTREEYLKKCQMIYDAFPLAGITTDIIVGFPTETEADFEESLRIVEEAGFSQIHAFPYSPREGTLAYRKYKELPSAVKKDRVERIMAKGAQAKEKFLKKLVGEVLEIVPEFFENGFWEGYLENYVRVYVEGEMEKEPTRVRVESLFKDGVKASIVK